MKFAVGTRIQATTNEMRYAHATTRDIETIRAGTRGTITQLDPFRDLVVVEFEGHPPYHCSREVVRDYAKEIR